MAYLTKKDNKSKYPITTGMNCGDGFKDGLVHEFYGTTIEVKLLMFIMKALEIKLTRLESRRFRFEADNRKIQKMMFKLCRYVRSTEITKFLKVMRRMIRKGVKPHNALLLAHYSRATRPNYFTSSMDLLAIYSTRLGFKTRAEWISRCNVLNNINGHYPVAVPTYNKAALINLIKQGNYLAAEAIVLNY